MKKVINIILTAIIIGSSMVSYNCYSQSQAGINYPRIIVSDESTVVPTIYGKVQGYLDGNIYTFKGIQYAQAERFMPPRFPDKFSNIKKCRIYGPKAPQNETLKWREQESDYDFAFQFNIEPMDEKHCQVLNVWTKGINDRKKRPVFVWLHGGGFSSGSGIDLPCYEGHSLAAKGDIVVVTINHRLNVLGYLDLRGLGGKYSESVNLGQQDIVKALEWVKSNISNFGGDPNNVTIGGQSGGGGKVSNIMAMPAAHGLFQKAIIQSGSNMPYSESNASKTFGMLFAKQLGISAANSDKLNDVSYEDLVKACNDVAKNSKGMNFGGILPTVDGKFITEAPIAPQISKDIPLMVGTNLYEFTYAASKPNITLNEAKEILTKKMGIEKAAQFIEEYTKVFPNMEPRDLLNTDFFFRPGAVVQANTKSSQNHGKVYFYLFTWKPKNSDIGSCHGMELPFMFNNISLQREMTRASEDAYKLADLMSSAWISFIKTGNPNTGGMPIWKPYTEKSGAVMFIDSKCHLKYHHDKALLQFNISPR